MAQTKPLAPVAIPTGYEVAKVNLLFRGVSRPGTANAELTYFVRQFITNSPSFTNAVFVGNITGDGDTNTFLFTMLVDLKHHFKL